MPTSDTRDAFERLVSALDYPMLIVTAHSEGEHAGCLVGFSTQASMEPPRFLVLLSKLNRTFRVASLAELLVVHFLDEANEDLAALFGEETGDATDKFARCAWREGPAGARVLEGVAGWLAGRVVERFDTGDHVAHLLEPTEAEVVRPGVQLGFQEVRDLSPGHPA